MTNVLRPILKVCAPLCLPEKGCIGPWLIVGPYDEGDEITKEVPLRTLTSLKWPYVPEASAYPDPLKRDDPKPLQTAQYEAIGSPALFIFVLNWQTLTHQNSDVA